MRVSRGVALKVDRDRKTRDVRREFGDVNSEAVVASAKAHDAYAKVIDLRFELGFHLRKRFVFVYAANVAKELFFGKQGA